MIGIAISMVFLAIYMSGFAVFRGLGETKCCLHLTILINLLHFVGSFVLINLMHLDILGSCLLYTSQKQQIVRGGKFRRFPKAAVFVIVAFPVQLVGGA